MLEKLYVILYKFNFKKYSKYKLSSFFYITNCILLTLVVIFGFLNIYIKFFSILQYFCLSLQCICFFLQIYANNKWDKTEIQLWNKLQFDFNYIEFINELLEKNGFEKTDRKYAYWYILSGNDNKLTKDEIKTYFMHFANHFHTVKWEYKHGPL